MLMPVQVVPFLLHEDIDVREQAAHYLNDMGDLAPPETAEQAWLAVERFGDQASRFGSLQSGSFLRLIGGLTPTDTNAQKAINKLAGTSNEDEIYWLNDVIRRQSLNFLAEHRTEWESLMQVEARKAIEARLALREAGAEALWQTLEQLDKEIAAADSSRGFTQRAEPVVQALQRYPDIAIANAMDVLRDPRERWWLEIWSAEIVCKLHDPTAVDLLIGKMQDDEGDFLREECEHGLPRMNPELAVPALESASNGNGNDPFFRNSIGVVLGNMKHSLAEAALIRLLEKEQDPMPRAFFATALCDLCTTDGLELLRDAVLKRNYDRSVSDLMEMLVTQCKFVGYAPPELPLWNKELENKATEQRARQRQFARMGLGKSPQAMAKTISSMLAGLSDEPRESAVPAPLAAREPAEITMPIRRSEAKVGRNDPCPCGSGKKYKKCCG